MTLVIDINYKEEKKYLTVKIWTACCKTTFVVEDRNSEMINLTTCQPVLPGMIKSIRLAEKDYVKTMLKMQSQTF